MSAAGRGAPRVALAALLAALAAPARAEGLVPSVELEGTTQLMLTRAYQDRFLWGGGGTVRGGLSIAGPLVAQVGLGSAWYPVAGQAPGSLSSLSVGLRGAFRLGQVVGGPFVDANAGAGVTGPLVRFVFDVGAGWIVYPAKWLGVGLVARYQQIVQPDNLKPADDAHLLTFGLNVAVRLQSEAPPPAPVVADRDGDGVPDAVDACPDKPEDHDGIADTDGCPEDDADGDGVPDAVDRCPLLPEVRNGFEDDDGCPDEAPPPKEVVTQRVVEREHGEPLGQEVRFKSGSDRVQPKFAETIAAVCREAEQRPPGTRVRVIGHADEQGTHAANARLGAARAGAVAEQLVRCGLAPERIESASFGDSKPSCTTGGASCLEQNRRVQFELLPPLSAP